MPYTLDRLRLRHDARLVAKRSKLGHDAIAELCGVKRPTVRAWLGTAENYQPSEAMCCLLAGHLGLSILDYVLQEGEIVATETITKAAYDAAIEHHEANAIRLSTALRRSEEAAYNADIRLDEALEDATKHRRRVKELDGRIEELLARNQKLHDRLVAFGKRPWWKIFSRTV
jgi:transcriptional regulator with XRE-family HTH domain